MPKIDDSPRNSALWVYLVVRGGAGSNTFEILDYTDVETTAQAYLDEYPDAQVYALVKTKEVQTRYFA